MKVQRTNKVIYCVECGKEVEAVLVSGRDAYPHRQDLYTRMFWKCPTCGNCVGTHRKTGIELGCIPNKEIKLLRKRIHEMMDPLWQRNLLSRQDLYAEISSELGYTYHTAEIRSMEEAREVIDILIKLKKRLEEGD